MSVGESMAMEFTYTIVNVLHWRYYNTSEKHYYCHLYISISSFNSSLYEYISTSTMDEVPSLQSTKSPHKTECARETAALEIKKVV